MSYQKDLPGVFYLPPAFTKIKRAVSSFPFEIEKITTALGSNSSASLASSISKKRAYRLPVTAKTSGESAKAVLLDRYLIVRQVSFTFTRYIELNNVKIFNNSSDVNVYVYELMV